jgi:hypothetical protein
MSCSWRGCGVPRWRTRGDKDEYKIKAQEGKQPPDDVKNWMLPHLLQNLWRERAKQDSYKEHQAEQRNEQEKQRK